VGAAAGCLRSTCAQPLTRATSSNDVARRFNVLESVPLHIEYRR
jgi:hypothetical protein